MRGSGRPKVELPIGQRQGFGPPRREGWECLSCLAGPCPDGQPKLVYVDAAGGTRYTHAEAPWPVEAAWQCEVRADAGSPTLSIDDPSAEALPVSFFSPTPCDEDEDKSPVHAPLPPPSPEPPALGSPWGARTPRVSRAVAAFSAADVAVRSPQRTESASASPQSVRSVSLVTVPMRQETSVESDVAVPSSRAAAGARGWAEAELAEAPCSEGPRTPIAGGGHARGLVRVVVEMPGRSGEPALALDLLDPVVPQIVALRSDALASLRVGDFLAGFGDTQGESQAVELYMRRGHRRAVQAHMRLQQLLDARSPVELLVARPTPFPVRVRKRENRQLGVDIARETNGMSVLIARVHPDGLLQEWNAQNPEQRVQQYDRIVSVNGCDGPRYGMVGLLKLLLGAVDLDLRVVRPRDCLGTVGAAVRRSPSAAGRRQTGDSAGLGRRGGSGAARVTFALPETAP